MVDHHVDRPGVEVRQRTQLTGPNHPIEFNNSNNLTNPHTQQSFIGTNDNECIMQSTKTNPTHQQLDRLDDLVALAGSLHPIPSRTRP